MSRICLDSSVLISLEKSQISAEDLRGQFPDAHFVITVISAYEQAYGAYILIKKGFQEKGRKILDGLKGFKIYPLTSKSAFLAAEISTEQSLKGKKIQPRDLFIAAICIQNKLELLTLNPKHFQPLTSYGLKLHDATPLLKKN